MSISPGKTTRPDAMVKGSVASRRKFRVSSTAWLTASSPDSGASARSLCGRRNIILTRPPCARPATVILLQSRFVPVPCRPLPLRPVMVFIPQQKRPHRGRNLAGKFAAQAGEQGDTTCRSGVQRAAGTGLRQAGEYPAGRAGRIHQAVWGSCAGSR